MTLRFQSGHVWRRVDGQRRPVFPSLTPQPDPRDSAPPAPASASRAYRFASFRLYWPMRSGGSSGAAASALRHVFQAHGSSDLPLLCCLSESRQSDSYTVEGAPNKTLHPTAARPHRFLHRRMFRRPIRCGRLPPAAVGELVRRRRHAARWT